MTNNDIMEEMSRRFIELIANYSGFYITKGRDYGVDFEVRQATKRVTRNRYLPTGNILDIQLKSTTEEYIRIFDTHIHYDLEVKNYNDLVDRMNESGHTIPLILILYLFPKDRKIGCN